MPTGRIRTRGRSPSVRSIVRDLVFVRPDLVFVRDAVRVSKPSYGVTWAVHGAVTPVIDPEGASFRIENGASRADVDVLDPPGAHAVLKAEPSSAGEGAWFNNEPSQTHATRVEVSSPKGAASRSFLAVITVGSVAVPKRTPAKLHEEPGVAGAIVASSHGTPMVVAFVAEDHARGAVRVDGQLSRSDLVVGLVPDATYAIITDRAGDRCSATLRAGTGRSATHAGTLTYTLERCVLR